MSFPIYDLPILREANDALLSALEALVRKEHVVFAAESIAQVCGYPLATLYRGQFTLLGIPSYDVPGCDGPEHRSFIVVSSASTIARVQDLRGRNFAVNDMHSNTGMNLPRHLLAPFAGGKRFLNRVVVTGSHRASIDAVLAGDADAAAIDCVTFGLHAAHEPDVIAGLRIIAHTSASPSIPFVTSRSTSDATVGAMRRALRSLSIRADFAPLRDTLRIKRIDVPGSANYDVLLDYRAKAVELGYPDLA